MNQWPQSSNRYLVTSKALAGSNMGPEAIEALKRLTRFNPNNRDAWLILANYNDKAWSAKAKAKLKLLDPLNKEFN